ncbi:MAG: hypothetical protein AB7I01_17575 [Gammaproteobacteria bacterium]
MPFALPCLFIALWLPASAVALILGEPFAAHYSVRDLGEPPGAIGNLGGLTFAPGELGSLLIGGGATSLRAAVYTVPLTRDAEGHIEAFAGPAELVASASGVSGGIDGGLAYGPGGVLFYTTYRDNQLGQIRPGSSAPDRLIDLGQLGVGRSTGALQFVPPGFAGAGRLKLLSFNFGRWYDASVAPDGNGTFDVNLSGTDVFIGGGPEGVVYIAAGNPGFERDSVLVSEWSLGRVVAYEVDANGDPIVATRRVFLDELSSAQGAAIDPVTGDFLFSKYAGDDRGVIVVGGFAPPRAVPLPSTWGLLAVAVGVLGRVGRWRRDLTARRAG